MDASCWSKAKSYHWGILRHRVSPWKWGRLPTASHSWEGFFMFVPSKRKITFVSTHPSQVPSFSMTQTLPDWDLQRMFFRPILNSLLFQQISVKRNVQLTNRSSPHIKWCPTKISAAQSSTVVKSPCSSRYVPWPTIPWNFGCPINMHSI